MTEPTQLATQTSANVRVYYLSVLANALGSIAFLGIVSRFIRVEEFGIVALTSVGLRFATFFNDLGLGLAIVALPTIDGDDCNVSFTIASLSGAILALATIVAAPYAASLLGTATVVPYLRVMAITLVLFGLQSTPLAIMRRSTRFTELALIETVPYFLVYCPVGIWMAIKGFGAWSLVVAFVAQTLVVLVVILLVSGYRPKLLWQPDRGKRLLFLGARFSASSFLEFLSGSADTVVASRHSRPYEVGLYTRPAQLLQGLLERLSNTAYQVVFAALGGGRVSRETLIELYPRFIGVVGFLVLSLAGVFWGASPAIVRIVFGAGWDGAIPLVRPLTIAAAIGTMSTVPRLFLDSSLSLARKLVVQFAFVIAVFAVGAPVARPDLVALAYAMVVLQSLRFTAFHTQVARTLGGSQSTVSRHLAVGVLCGLLCGAAVWCANELLANATVTVRCVADLLTGLAVSLGSIRWLLGHDVRSALEVVSAVLPLPLRIRQRLLWILGFPRIASAAR